MNNLKELNPLYFKIKGKLARLLGRESLSNPAVAICELIKNSYDADATEVIIEFRNVKFGKGHIKITDNGSGLTLEKIEKQWMTVATDEKENQPKTKLKRRKIGEKGIARFATEMIAHNLELISKPESSTCGYKILINWDDYEKAAYFDKTPNKCFSFKKKKKDQGLELLLSNLREKWGEDKMKLLYKEIELLVPPVPTRRREKFFIKIRAPEFPKYSRVIKPTFLNQAVFVMKSSLLKDGTIDFWLQTYKGKTLSKKSTTSYGCGPVEFKMFFFYRDKGKYSFEVDIKNLRETLNRYGGLHLYRDGLKVNLSEADWAGLDGIRINDPSWYPSNKQVIGIINITRDGNPEILDTTTRETIIKKPAFKDLVRFIHKSIDFFVEFRRKVEKKKIKKRKKIISKLPPEKLRESFIDFSLEYPEVFYKNLENEINSCYESNLPNAVLLLSRKLVENLVYNLFEYKFPKKPDLRWNITKNRPLDFSVLLDNLTHKKNEFSQEEQRLIKKFLELCKPFKREANSKAHNIMEYVENRNQLGNLKIPEIIQIVLKLIAKNKK
ncbi:MAG: ATP-binding protein [Candidatus Nealsonbacteria bacterium]